MKCLYKLFYWTSKKNWIEMGPLILLDKDTDVVEVVAVREKVLLIDDESEVRELVSEVLSQKYQVLLARDERQGVDVALREKPAVIILDSEMSGVELCNELRGHSETRFTRLLLSGKFESGAARAGAFAAGADGLLLKPLVMEEGLALVDSKIRRRKEENQFMYGPASNALQFGKFKIHFSDIKVTIAESPVEMGSVEFKILSLLVRNHGQLVEREKLNKFVWGDNIPSERALDPHINSLRKKLSGSDVDLKTVYGIGYSFVTSPQPHN